MFPNRFPRFLGQVSLGQYDPCAEYKGGMDAFAKKIAAFNQQAREALARGDNAGANQASQIAQDASRSWEWQRYLYEKCKRGEPIQYHERSVVRPPVWQQIPPPQPTPTPTPTPPPTPTPTPPPVATPSTPPRPPVATPATSPTTTGYTAPSEPSEIVTMDDFMYGEPVQTPSTTPGPTSEGVESCPDGWIRNPATGECLPPTPTGGGYRPQVPGGLLNIATGGFGAATSAVSFGMGKRIRVANLRP